MNKLKYELTDRANSLQKYNFFLKNMGAQETLEEMVQQIIDEKKKAKIFDIGCGEAGALKELKQLFGKKVTVCGADAIKTTGLDEFVFGNAAKKSFPAKCELVISFRALHEIANLKTVFEKISKSLSTGGLVILSIRLQQQVGERIFFHGNLTQADMDFLGEIEKIEEFKGLKVLVIKIWQKHGEQDSVSGANVFLSKIG